MDYEIETYLNVLQPEDTTAGGGSASAIAGAMAAALVAMVCRLPVRAEDTVEKERLKQALAQAAEQAEGLSKQLLVGSRLDSEAFQMISKSYRLPKESDEERQRRSKTIQAAWVGAAQAPLDNASQCVQVLRMVTDLAGRTNLAAESDMKCARLLASAGALGCLENVEINLGSIEDAMVVSALAQQADEIRNQVKTLRSPAGLIPS